MLNDSEFSANAFGAKFIHVYSQVQQHEYAEFNRHVSSLEIDWYQRTL